ncbi:MAG: dihydroorotate dehydrogenase electron transfer subunit [Piscirickettsiaceae bacterium]|nr:MAG: dihydroorotate dehydrogenase electron transfer subunit [Piscirickettsiaceae bacterium]
MQENTRNTIFVEDAEVLVQHGFEEEQYVLRVHAPKCARSAKPGQFAHIQCDDQRLMRRPLSIMRVSAQEGWVEFLYKAVGAGTALLAKRQVGELVNVMGPIGRPFALREDKPIALLLGGGVGIPPMICLSESIKKDRPEIKPFVFMGSEVPFPFERKASRLRINGLAADVSGCLPLLEEWNIPSRLASLQGYEGVYQGYITDLARDWLNALSDQEKQQVAIYSCGPTPMLKAVAALAKEFDLPCQVSLEEYMACAVGGCAGCVVKVTTDQGEAMKRVCVDGPVFEAETVFA